MVTALDIIKKGVEMGASDVHITVFRPPVYRVNGHLLPDSEQELLTAEDTHRLGEEIIPNAKIRATLEENGQVDFSNAFPGVGRFRVNIYIQRGSWAIAIRIIPLTVPELSNLNLPLWLPIWLC